MRIVEARFVAEARSIESLPPPDLAEVAFAGRSNVGKSSALRAVLGDKSLVRVSKTPGQTRGIVFFSGRLCRPGGDRAIGLVDLPGYGYARVGKAERRSWGPLVERYLRDRSTLRAVVCLVDARHEPQPADRELIEYVASCGRRVLVVATKIDKIGKARRKPAVAALGRALGADAPIGFSAVDATGLAELLEALDGATL